MPIKFRCSYCRQFLGISRAQAGGVVDCPSCGRAIRVPLLDGTVQPMQAPELDLDDTHLTRALDELAKLISAPPSQVARTSSSQIEQDDGEIENQIPQPLPEPIPIEVPLPPTPISLQAPVNVSPAAMSGAGEQGLLDELASLGNSQLTKTSTEQISEGKLQAAHEVRSSRSLFIYSFILFLAFVAGMVTERFLRAIEGVRRNPDSIKVEAKEPIADNVLSGRITYKTNEGESQPDRGARIIIFPQQKVGVTKLSVVGFRPADSQAEQAAANAAIKTMGGAAGTVDRNGSFRIPIEAGSYRILVLSHFQPAENSTHAEALDKLLAEYFENPDDVLGHLKYQFSTLRIKGISDTWDHAF